MSFEGEGDTSLIIAAKANDLSLVKSIVEQRKKEHGCPSLQPSLRFRFREITCPLIVNLSNVMGNSPIHYAVMNGNFDMVEYLDLQGAKMDRGNNRLDTPLIIAARNNNFKIAQWLVFRGARVNFENIVGETPLSLALGNGNARMADMLIEKGADFNQFITHPLFAPDAPLFRWIKESVGKRFITTEQQIDDAKTIEDVRKIARAFKDEATLGVLAVLEEANLNKADLTLFLNEAKDDLKDSLETFETLTRTTRQKGISSRKRTVRKVLKRSNPRRKVSRKKVSPKKRKVLHRSRPKLSRKKVSRRRVVSKK